MNFKKSYKTQTQNCVLFRTYRNCSLNALLCRRWVTFTGELGDLELISAYPYSWEVQSVMTDGGDPTPLGGSFSVQFGEFTSEDLPYDATADGFKAALEALAGAGRVDVSKIVLGNGRNEWLVTFRSAHACLFYVQGSDCWSWSHRNQLQQ